MKKIMKKILSALMIVLMLFTMVPLQGFVGLDMSGWFVNEAEAAGLQLDDDDYIATHEYFVNSEQYYYMMENGCLYNNVDSDFLSDAIAAGTIWGLVGDMGKMLTLQFSNSSLLKMVSSNPFDLILADLLISYTGGDTFNSASTATAFDFYNKSYETLMNMLKSTSEWEDSYEETLSFEIKGILRDPNYDFSDSNAYSIFEKCLGKLFKEGTLMSIFDGLDCASKISEVLSTAANIVDGFLEAYHAYSAALAFLNVSEYFAHSIRMAETHMDSVAAILLEVALSNYEENINSDEDAFNFALEQFRNSTAKTLWGIVESIFTQSNTKFMAKVIGASPAEFGILTFVYNTTYQLLDCILKHSDTTNLAILTYAASLFEDGLSFSTEDIANSLRVNPCIENAQFFDCSWGMLQCVEQYGYKTAAEFSLSKNLGTRIIKFFNKAHTNNDMEVAASWQSAWRSSSCHTIIIRASKDVLVQCPVDIEVYDSEDNLLFVINDDIVDNDYKDTFVEIYGGDKKFFSIPCDTDCKVVIRSREDGEMSYKVFENNNFSTSRVVEYNDIQLVTGKVFECDIPSQINVSANSYNLITDGEVVEYDYDSLPPIEDNIVDVIVAEELFDGFPVETIDLVADTMFNMKSVVDLSAYDISTDDTVALFSAVAKYYPAEYSLIANSDFTYKIIVSPNLDRIMKIRFYYGDDANLDIYQKRVKDLNSEIDALVAKVEGMNEFEKALYIHDYIVLNCEYDLELLEILETNGTLTGELRSERYTEYSVLVNGTGICGSYALAYRAILNAAGMECLYLSSSQMNHAWNLVKIDGKWYHVDCCWDDPTPDTYGRARRTYFLRTDDEIMNLNHYSWTPGQYKANSDKYSDMPRNYDIKQKYDDGKWYYLTGSTLYSSDEYGKNETEITSISASSIDADNGNVYYSNGRYIYEYNIETEKTAPVYMLSNKDSGDKPSQAYLSNVYIDGENVEFYISTISDDKRIIAYKTDLLHKDTLASITGISLACSEASIDVFEENTLTATIEGHSSVNTLDVYWSSSDNAIVSVDKNGIIKGMNVGVATISANILGYSASCVVKVSGDGLSGMCGDNAQWRFDVESDEIIISGSGDMDSYSYGESRPWDNFIDSIKTIIVNSKITSIGTYAFYNCDYVSSIIINDGVISIGNHSFSACDSVEAITLPASVTTIGPWAFQSCKKLSTVVFAEESKLQTICEDAFDACVSLKTITIPASVTTIEDEVFRRCDKLEKINVDYGNTVFSSLNGVLYNSSKTTLVTYPCGGGTTFEIPRTVTTIESYAFLDCIFLTSIIIPKNVTTVGSYAFGGCKNLTTVSFERNSKISSLGDDMFAGCESLSSVTIPSSVTSIGSYAFASCNNLKMVLFEGASQLKTIGSYAFEKCKTLKTIEIPYSVTTIGNNAFSNCNNLSEVIFKKDSQLKSILSSAFQNCDSLSTITIPTSVSLIGNNAFTSCDNLKSIYVEPGNTSYSSENGVLFNADKTTLVLYPKGGDASYELPNKVTTIAYGAFDGCSNLVSVIFPKDSILETIESYSFSNCDSLSLITLPASLKSIGIYAFSSCDNLSEVLFVTGSELKTISSGAFAHCKSLFSITIPASVTTISRSIFINIGAFENCHNLVSVIFEENSQLKTIGKNTFSQCYALKLISIPDSVTSIEERAFSGCMNLSHIGYIGTETKFGEIEIDDGNTSLTKAKKIHYNFAPKTDVIIQSAKPSTCITNGFTETIYCVICQCYIFGEIIPLTDHNYLITESAVGTCEKAPYDVYSCSFCEDTYIVEGKIEEGHNYKKTVILPTCDEKGYTKEVCIVCGETLLSDFTSPKGHEFVINRPDGYCSAHDTLEYSCKICSYKEFVCADSANLVTETVTVEPTCTKSGSKTEICTLCKATISIEILNPLSHDYAEEFTVDKAVTCTSEGRKSQHCTRCDAKRAVTVIEATGHQNTSIINVVESTCAKNGYSGDTFCSDCNSVIANGTETEKLSHTESDWITDRTSTCTAEGSKHIECIVCEEVIKIESIAKLSHEYTSVVTKANCESGGYTTYTCSNCSDSYVSDKTPAIGHSYVDGVCTACGESKIDNCSHMCHKSGFMGFIWKIVRFFWKLFGMNPVCNCGVKHY